MNGNNKNKTTLHKERTSFFSGKTKHVILLLSAVLILTCILVIPLASGKIQPIALNTQTNSVNSNGAISVNENPIITLGGIPSGGMSLVGNMTTIGDTTLNGLLNISKFDKVVLGPPTINGSQNITAESIEIDKPCYAGDTITLTGTPSNTSIVNICGNIIIGKEFGWESTANEISMNITNFYQYVESHNMGYVGDYIENEDFGVLTNDLPLNTKDAIKVQQGTLNIYGWMNVLGLTVYNFVTINSTTFNLTALTYILGLPVPVTILVPLDQYDGWANVSQMNAEGKFGLLSFAIGDVMDTCCMYWLEPTTFEAKGPWFALGSGGGIITMYDTYTQMISNDTMNYTFLKDSEGEAGFRVTNSTNYPQAIMNITTLEQVVNGQGQTYLTNGSLTLTGATVKQINQIVNGTLTFQGNMTQQGNITIQGNIGISGYNYMQGLITVQGYMNINNGLTSGTINLTIDGTMETTGSMNITNGAISIPSGSMVMNDTGSFITGDTINVTGDQITSQGTIEINGDTTMQGDIAMGGTSYINGPVSISGSLDINGGTMTGTGTITVSNGYMQTVGNMNIRNGTVTVSGKILMDPSGTQIGSTTTITGKTITVNGIVTNAGSVKMTGTFLLMIPMSITGVMVTNGITAMGSLGTINGVMNVMGDIMMSGMTIISGDNNIMGSMTVMPGGVAIYGLVGLTGMVYTSSIPAIGPTTILEIPSGSMMGLNIPHVSILMNPLALAAIGILGIGTVYVVGKILYFGIKERRTLIQLTRIYGREMGRNISKSIKKLFRGARSRTNE